MFNWQCNFFDCNKAREKIVANISHLLAVSYIDVEHAVAQQIEIEN